MSTKRLLPRLFWLFLAAAMLAPPAALAGDWQWPVDGEVITKYRNVADPYAGGQHRGIDIATPLGSRVAAATSGSVTFAGRLPDSGFCATVRSDDGAYLVSYLHLSSVAIAKGDHVTAGSTIGTAGDTGVRSASTPHLHLSVRLSVSGTYVDPLPLLGPQPVKTSPQSSGGKPAPAAQLPAPARPAHAELPTSRPQRDKANRRAKGHRRAQLRSPKHRRVGVRERVTHQRPAPKIAPRARLASAAHAPHAVAASAPSAAPTTSRARLGGRTGEIDTALPAAFVAPAHSAGEQGRPSVRLALFALAGSLIAILVLRARAGRAASPAPVAPVDSGAAETGDPAPDNVHVLPL